MHWYKVTFKVESPVDGVNRNRTILIKAVNYIDAETTSAERIEEYFFNQGEIINITKTKIKNVIDISELKDTDFSDKINFQCKLQFSSIDVNHSWTELVMVNAENLEKAVKTLKEDLKEDKTVSEIYSITTTDIDNIFFPEELEEA